MKRNVAYVVLSCMMSVSCNSTSSESEAKTGFAILTSDGRLLLSTRDIVSYDWANHVIRLRPGVKERIFDGLNLIHGKEFSVSVDGKEVYRGNLWTPISSFSCSTAVICDLDTEVPLLDQKNHVRIQLGYPSLEFFRGEDPRSHQSIRNALLRASLIEGTDG